MKDITPQSKTDCLSPGPVLYGAILPMDGRSGNGSKKAVASVSEGATVVMLLPARTDTQWFHRYIYHQAEIRFVPGRLKFGGAKWNAPFPCMVVIFRPGREEQR